jgi:hypothetical protein
LRLRLLGEQLIAFRDSSGRARYYGSKMATSLRIAFFRPQRGRRRTPEKLLALLQLKADSDGLP